jgi:hypothetical protein
MAAYTDSDAIAAYLGTTFNAAQEAQATTVAAAVTAWIDQRTGRSWQTSGSVSGELHQVYADKVWLNAPPVLGVSAVSLHPGTAVGSWTALDAADYTLFDAARGLLLLPLGYGDQYAQVSYTSLATPPDDIMLAADVLAADLLMTTLNPESAGAESVSVGQNDITVRYAGSGGQLSASVQQAIAAVDAHRRPVLA